MVDVTPTNLSNDMVLAKAPVNPFTGALYSYADSANPMYVNPKGFDATANRAERRIAASRKQVDQLIAIDPTSPLTVLLRIMGERKGQKIRADLDELRGVKAEKEAKKEFLAKAYENIQRSRQEKEFGAVTQEFFNGNYVAALEAPNLSKLMALEREKPPVLDIKDKLTITANLFRMEREIAEFEKGFSDMTKAQANLKRNMINEASVALGYKSLADFHTHNKAPVDPNKATIKDLQKQFGASTNQGGLRLGDGGKITVDPSYPTAQPDGSASPGLLGGFGEIIAESEVVENLRDFTDNDPDNELFAMEAVKDMFTKSKYVKKFEHMYQEPGNQDSDRVQYNRANNVYVKRLENGYYEVGYRGGDVIRTFTWDDTNTSTKQILFPTDYWGLHEKALEFALKHDPLDPTKPVTNDDIKASKKIPAVNVWSVDAVKEKSNRIIMSSDDSRVVTTDDLSRKFPKTIDENNPEEDDITEQVYRQRNEFGELIPDDSRIAMTDDLPPKKPSKVIELMDTQTGSLVSTDGDLFVTKAKDGNYYAYNNEGVSLIATRTEAEMREFVVKYKDMLVAEKRVKRFTDVADEDAQQEMVVGRSSQALTPTATAESGVEGLRSKIARSEIAGAKNVDPRRAGSTRHLEPEPTSAEIRLKDVLPETATTDEPGKKNFFLEMFEEIKAGVESIIVAANEAHPELAERFPNVHPWFFKGTRNESTTQKLERLSKPPPTVKVLSNEEKLQIDRTKTQKDIGAGDSSQRVTGGEYQPPKGWTPPTALKNLVGEEYVIKVRKLDRALDALIFVENETADPYAIGFKLEKHRRSDGKLYHVQVDDGKGGKMKVPQAYGLAQLTIATARKMKTGGQKGHKHLSDDEFRDQVLFNKKKNIMIAKEYVNIIREKLRKNKYARKFKKHEFDALVAATYNTGEGIIKKVNAAKPKDMDDLISKLQDKLERQTVTQIERFREIIGDR